MVSESMKWLCGSMKPGTSVLPCRLTTRVALPRKPRSTSAREPTATILPSFTATASAFGLLSLTVTMSPPE